MISLPLSKTDENLAYFPPNWCYLSKPNCYNMYIKVTYCKYST